MKTLEEQVRYYYIDEKLTQKEIAHRLELPIDTINRVMVEHKIKRKRLSPFSVEFWIEKGYPPEEAEYIRNTKRPINKEYWMVKGYTEEESILKAKEVKSSNDKKGAKKSASRDTETIRKSSRRCIEFWIKLGYSEEEAVEKVSEEQRTFTKELCIQKHGEKEGLKVWQERQDKWQNTLKSKTDEEIARINSLKNYKKVAIELYKNNEISMEEFKEQIEKYNIEIFAFNKQDLINYILEDINNNPDIKYSSAKTFHHRYRWNSVLLDLNRKFFQQFVDTRLFLRTGGKFSHYCLRVEEGFLRSSHEIFFYDLLKEYDIEFEIEKLYNDSNMRCDFYITKTNEYIEIAPMYNKDESYTKKMNKKKELFNCILLTDGVEYKKYVKSIS